MSEHNERSPSGPMTRRQFLLTGLAAAGTLALAACGFKLASTKESGSASPSATASVAPSGSASPQGTVLESTPACGTDPTPEQTEGPYFTPNSPERTSLLEQGMAGTKLTITGFVMTSGCQPVKNALLDFWQADANGEYDNSGYSLRGHQFTDDKGKFTLHTVVPGLYPGRTRHIHVKVQAPNEQALTTQLYFPNESGNANDGIFHERLVMNVRDNADSSRSASYNFVV